MRRLANRLDKLEQAVDPPQRLVHVEPGRTDAQAIAAHERAHGKIPKDAHVILIRHTFTSRL